MDSFVDTNIPIAYVFSIDPHNKRAISVYENYDNIFWSNKVYMEFSDRCFEKLNNLLEFYQTFEFDLKKWPNMLISKKDMINYVKNKRYDIKTVNDIVGSFDPFLGVYVQSYSFIVIDSLLEGIHNFIGDLNSNVYSKIEDCENLLICVPNRKKMYNKLFQSLKKLGVHESDANIVLDAHDFGLDNPLDFVTFDKDFYNGVINMELSFNNVRCLDDFNLI